MIYLFLQTHSTTHGRRYGAAWKKCGNQEGITLASVTCGGFVHWRTNNMQYSQEQVVVVALSAFHVVVSSLNTAEVAAAGIKGQIGKIFLASSFLTIRS